MARRALRELFRDERLSVGPDPERGFRVEGTAWLSVALKERTARTSQDLGRFTGRVAGGRSVRLPIAVCSPFRGRPRVRPAGSPIVERHRYLREGLAGLAGIAQAHEPLGRRVGGNRVGSNTDGIPRDARDHPTPPG